MSVNALSETERIAIYIVGLNAQMLTRLLAR